MTTVEDAVQPAQRPAAPTGTPLLDLAGITKAFPGCLANDDISFAIMPGEIHALLGENGAGKSTLVKIIYGVLKPDRGELRWNGQAVHVAGPSAARNLGIGMVFQHFSLFEAMTVLENVSLALEGEPLSALRERLLKLSESYGLPLDPDRHVHDLSVGERQRIEIVRCLLQNPKLLILDEPTSVLTPQEVERMFETLHKLSAEGCAILYISHKLDEVKALCDTATILRGGRKVAECDPKRESARSLAELMIGEKVSPPSRPERTVEAKERLVVSGLTAASDSEFGVDLKDIGFSVSGGEILGIAGIAGNGQTELMSVLTGETLVPAAGAITIDGEEVGAQGPAPRRALGAAFVPEERNGHGAVPALSLSDNAFLTAFRRLGLVRNGLIADAPTKSYAEQVIGDFDVRTTGPAAEAGSLSGGNLQKFIVGREILQDPGVLVISQPTWGVDAGAAASIHQALLDLAARGTAVLVISQDLDEIFTVCDRIAVISEGTLSDSRPVGEVTIEQIGLLMGGLHGLEGEGKPHG
ncbi:MAG: ABC transporter ATP-binding protein [Pseudomonadota bacterium]